MYCIISHRWWCIHTGFSGTGTGTGTWTRKNGLYGFLRRNFHTAPEEGQGTWTGTGKNGYVPIFQVLKLFRCVLMIFQWLSGVQSWPQTQPVWIHHKTYWLTDLFSKTHCILDAWHKILYVILMQVRSLLSSTYLLCSMCIETCTIFYW